MYGRGWFERFAPYARSKFAQVMSALELNGRIKSSRVTVNCMEPGMVKTDIYRYDPLAQFMFKGLISLFAPFILLKPEEGAVTAIWLALSPDVHQISGRIFSDLREIPTGLAVENVRNVMPGFMTQLTQQALHRS